MARITLINPRIEVISIGGQAFSVTGRRTLAMLAVAGRPHACRAPSNAYR